MSDSTKKKVAYCGIEGAFAHIAAKKLFPEDQLVSFPSFSIHGHQAKTTDPRKSDQIDQSHHGTN